MTKTLSLIILVWLSNLFVPLYSRASPGIQLLNNYRYHAALDSIKRRKTTRVGKGIDYQLRLRQSVSRYFNDLHISSIDKFTPPSNRFKLFSKDDHEVLEDELHAQVVPYLFQKMDAFEDIGKTEENRPELEAICLGIFRALSIFPEEIILLPLGKFVSLIRYTLFEFYHEEKFSSLIDGLFLDHKGYLLNYVVHHSEASSHGGCFMSGKVTFDKFLHCVRVQNDLLFLAEKITGFREEFGLESDNIQNIKSCYSSGFLVTGSYLHNLQTISKLSALRILFILKKLQAMHEGWQEAIGCILSEEESLTNKGADRDFDLYGRYGLAGEIIKKSLRREGLLSEKEEDGEALLYQGLWAYLIELIDKGDSEIMNDFLAKPFLSDPDLLVFLLK